MIGESSSQSIFQFVHLYWCYGLICFTLWHPAKKRGFSEKNTEMHVALRRNYSNPIWVTDLVEVSKDAASLLVCAQKKFLVGG